MTNTCDLNENNMDQAAASLTDDHLISGGFKPIHAFVRSGPSKSAKKTRKRRDVLKEKYGIIQINVEAPSEVGEIIREFARRTRGGEEGYRVLYDLARMYVPQHLVKPVKTKSELDRERQLMQLGYRVASLQGWRRTLAKVALRK